MLRAMSAVNQFLTSMTDSNKIILGLIVGAMIAFDMGGPINKVAYSLMVAMWDQEYFLMPVHALWR